MSKRHQVNRRRAYGRRQHEIRERDGRVQGADERRGYSADTEADLEREAPAAEARQVRLRFAPAD